MATVDEKYKSRTFRQSPFFKMLSPSQLRTLLQNITISTYAPHDFIFRQGGRLSHIMYVKSGLVKVFKERNTDSSLLMKIVASDQFLGLSSQFGYENYMYSAGAITNTEVMFIDKAYFESLIHENPAFNHVILSQLSAENNYMFTRMLSLSYKHLPGRLADLILFFSKEVYKSESFTIPISRKEMAEFSGTSTESIIRMLSEFKNDKIIELEGSQITIKSMELIKLLSENG